MNLNLGKIFLLLIVPILSFAGSVSAKLSQAVVYKDDIARLTLRAEGNNIHFPDISTIGTVPVLSTSSSQSTTIINGKYSQVLSKSYLFKPAESLVIPSYEIEVDGKFEMTEPLTLKVTKPSPASKDASVQLEMKASKVDVYVGEPITLDLLFKTLPNARYDKAELSEVDLKNFWVKKLPTVRSGVDGDYTIQGYRYVLFPQQEGNFTIPAPFVQLGKIVQSRGQGGFFNDPFFSSQRMSWKKIYANELSINVKPLPNGLDIYGDFSIKAHVDKQEVKANKPLNLTIEIKGAGNLEDIKKIELDIPNAVVYSDETKVYPNPGGIKGVFSQKIAIIADRNFTIPSIEFRFFDGATKAEKIIKTEAIDIHVVGGTKQQVVEQKLVEKSPITAKDSEIKEKSMDEVTPKTMPISQKSKILWYFLGLFSGIFLSLLLFMARKKLQANRRKKEIPLFKQIRKAQDDKVLFELLLPYRDDDPFIKECLHKLEKNIYAQGDEQIDKEELIEIFEELL